MVHDARYIAANILNRLKLTALQGEFCCYGTGDRLLLGIGRAASLTIVDQSSLDSVWRQIDDFISAHGQDYIMGFLGFDPGNELARAIVSSRKRADLFVPELVIECTRRDFKLLKGALPDAADASTLDAAPDLEESPLDIASLDEATADKGKYQQAVSAVLRAIRENRLERATLARKIVSPWPFDLTKTLLADNSLHALSRSFYFSNDCIAFAGQSPELLADGTVDAFSTHKLSGTCAKQSGLTRQQLLDEFSMDPRIVAENHSAIATIEQHLNRLGAVDVDRFQIMDLPTLLHGWSRFTTRPVAGTRVAECLRSIFPYGMNPVEVGFELLKAHEDFERGPYYGLVGCIQPDGQFTFSQVLRTAFTEEAGEGRSGSYVMVGAAITGLSTPELELAETKTKLNAIRLYRAEQGEHDSAHSSG